MLSAVYQYRVHQFRVTSEIPLPCHPESPEAVAAVGVGDDAAAPFVRVLRATEPLPTDAESGTRMPVAKGLTLHVDREGTTIRVETPRQNDTLAALYVVGVGLAHCALLHGRHPLHAASGTIDGHWFGILGDSGAGKSTTMWALLRAGALFGGDDVLHVRCRPGESRALAFPCVSLYPKIGREILESERLDPAACPEVCAGEGKYWVPLHPARRAGTAGPLEALFILDPRRNGTGEGSDGDGDGVTAERVSGPDVVRILMENTYRQWTARVFQDRKPRFLAEYLQLANVTPVYRLRYPRRFSALPFLVQTLCERLGASLPAASAVSTLPIAEARYA